MFSKYPYTKIGLIISILSFLLSFTFIIPIYVVAPAIFLHDHLSELFSYTTSGWATIIILIIVLLTTSFLIFTYVNKMIEGKNKLNYFLAILLFISFFLAIHSLGYFLLLAYFQFPIDAFNAISSAFSFLLTSWSFVLMGYLMDRSINKINYYKSK